MTTQFLFKKSGNHLQKPPFLLYLNTVSMRTQGLNNNLFVLTKNIAVWTAWKIKTSHSGHKLVRKTLSRWWNKTFLIAAYLKGMIRPWWTSPMRCPKALSEACGRLPVLLRALRRNWFLKGKICVLSTVLLPYATSAYLYSKYHILSLCDNKSISSWKKKQLLYNVPFWLSRNFSVRTSVYWSAVVPSLVSHWVD